MDHIFPTAAVIQMTPVHCCNEQNICEHNDVDRLPAICTLQLLMTIMIIISTDEWQPSFAKRIITNEKWRANLSFLGLVAAVLGKEVCQYIATARCQVNEWSFFAYTQSSWDRHHHTDRLGQQCPLAEVATDHKPTQDRLHLDKPTTLCLKKTSTFLFSFFSTM